MFLPFKNSEEPELDTVICTSDLICVHGGEMVTARVTSNVSSGLRESWRTVIGQSGGQTPPRAGPDNRRPQTDRRGPGAVSVSPTRHIHTVGSPPSMSPRSGTGNCSRRAACLRPSEEPAPLHGEGGARGTGRDQAAGHQYLNRGPEQVGAHAGGALWQKVLAVAPHPE